SRVRVPRDAVRCLPRRGVYLARCSPSPARAGGRLPRRGPLHLDVDVHIASASRLTYLGGLNSLDSKPAHDFRGSVGTRSITTCSHFGHSNERLSKLAPSGEIRASIMRVPHRLHTGRSMTFAKWKGSTAPPPQGAVSQ